MTTVALGDVVAVRSSLVDPTEDKYANLPHIAPDTIERDTGRLLPYTTIGESGVQSGKYRFEAGDVLYSKIRPNLNKVALINFDGLCSADMYALQVNSTRIASAFLQHLLRSPLFVGYATNLSSRANIPKLNRVQLLRFQFDLPPLDEQRRIAAILDQADALRSARRQTIGLAEESGKAVFLEMFGQFTSEYVAVDDVALPEQGSIRTGPFGSQLLHSEFVSQGISVLGLDNVVGNAFRWGERRFISPAKYDTLKRYTVRPGDVLVSIMGTCGRCVVVPPDVGVAINTKHICAITLDPRVALPEFVRASFLWHPQSRQYLTQQTKGAIMDGLNMGIIKRMPLPLPSVSLQQQFVSRLSEIDGFFDRLRKSSEQLGELFAALQFRAFSGQL